MTKYCYYCTKNGGPPTAVSEHDSKCWNCGAGVFYTFVKETKESIQAQQKYRESTMHKTRTWMLQQPKKLPPVDIVKHEYVYDYKPKFLWEIEDAERAHELRKTTLCECGHSRLYHPDESLICRQRKCECKQFRVKQMKKIPDIRNPKNSEVEPKKPVVYYHCFKCDIEIPSSDKMKHLRRVHRDLHQIVYQKADKYFAEKHK